MLSSQLVSKTCNFCCLLILFFVRFTSKKWLTGCVTFQSQKRKIKTTKQTNKQIYTFIHVDFVSLTRAVEDDVEEHGGTSSKNADGAFPQRRWVAKRPSPP